MSEFTEQTVASIETLVDDMTTMVLIEPPGNTTIPIITNIPYHPGFPEYGRVRACDWCRGVECTDPECVTMLQLEEEAKDRTCLACEQVFSTEREVADHYQYCNFRKYPEYSEFCCDCCGSYFENQEQLDYHNPELCWNQQQQQQEQVIYCNCCGVSFETQEQLNDHDQYLCWDKNRNHECSCCGEYCESTGDLLIHERECWNEYEMSRMDNCYDQDQWDEYQDELEQERLADFREQCREEMRELKAARAASRAEDCWDACEERDHNY
jgi:hypothetical protein